MYSVLVVDDEELITEGMKMLVDWEALGFAVPDTAGDGHTALRMLGRRAYHLLITDIRMPEMGGLELIEALRSTGCRTKCIILSGYGDFQYAQKAIRFGVANYLLKPVEAEELARCLTELRQELDEESDRRVDERQTRNMARDKLLQDYAAGALTADSLGRRCERFGIRLEGEQVQVAVVELTFSHKPVRDSMYDDLLYRFGVRNIMEETIEHSGRGYVYDESEGMIGVLFHGNGCGDEGGDNLRLLRSVCEAVRKWLKQEIAVGLGAAVSLEQAKTSRKQALCAIDQDRGDGEAVRVFEQVPAPEDAVWTADWDSDGLIRCLEEGDYGRMTQLIDGFVREKRERRLSNAVVQGQLFGLFPKLGRLIKRYGDDPAPFLAELERELLQCLGTGEPPLERWLGDAMLRSGKHLAQLAKKKEPHVVHAILEFIGGHYAEDLSLKQIAGLYYMNTAYLGQLFKQKTGEPFNDYLNRTRISHVKRALAQNAYNGMETIHEAGFKSVEHFYRQFKRYEGVAFSEYKERLQAL